MIVGLGACSWCCGGWLSGGMMLLNLFARRLCRRFASWSLMMTRAGVQSVIVQVLRRGCVLARPSLFLRGLG